MRVMEYAGSRLIALQELQRTSRLFISGVHSGRLCRRKSAQVRTVSYSQASSTPPPAGRGRLGFVQPGVKARRRWRVPNAFFTGCGDIGARVAYHARLSGKRSPMSQPGGGFLATKQSFASSL
ncbi:hypothetical protein SAMN05443248_0283 [Bradyrhizobium erythrophlei]|uniref:Uncharacterized protein n=1 Tax=Bradyrhizobium erythrophlei TaxID=1437360 RepID=A0A1M5H286_9BRAD|nr:hypothetical protein SAMN05443248_0283 [Bradyrhizobium erythrophlei]